MHANASMLLVNLRPDVYIYPPRENKIYTAGNIGNSQRMLTEMNKTCAIAKVTVLVENDTVKHLNTFGTISG